MLSVIKEGRAPGSVPAGGIYVPFITSYFLSERNQKKGEMGDPVFLLSSFVVVVAFYSCPRKNRTLVVDHNTGSSELLNN